MENSLEIYLGGEHQARGPITTMLTRPPAMEALALLPSNITVNYIHQAGYKHQITWLNQ